MTPSRQAVFLLSAAALMGCGPARVGLPTGEPLRLASAEARAGEVVYMRHCHQCHPGGAAGLGPALTDKPLPGFLVAFQVRHGLGAMPAFDASSIAPHELDALVAYVGALRDAR